MFTSMGSRDEDEKEQRPLTTADIRALLDELMEEQEERHKEQEERVKEEMQQKMELQDEKHKEEMHALLSEQEEQTDRRFKDLERALTSSSSRPQDADNDNFTDNQQSSNSRLVPNRPRRGNTTTFSLLMFRTRRNSRTNDDNDNDEGDDDYGSPHSEGLEEDTFSIMMMNKPFREIPYIHPTLVKMIFMGGLLGLIIIFADVILNVEDSLGFRNLALGWSVFITSWIMMLGPLSGPWLFSTFTFAVLQLGLALAIVFDQTLIQSATLGCLFDGETCVPWNIPIGTWEPLTVVQYLTLLFALVTQNDIVTSIQTLIKLRNADNVPWDEVIGQKGNRTWRLWACQILLPNILKFLQAVITLFVTLIVILQSTGIVPMLKDFTALFVLSEADNIMFHAADLGYFGEDLAKKTEEVKVVQWMVMEEEREEGQDINEGEEKRCHRRRWCHCSMGSCVFLTLCMVMNGTLTYFVAGQYNGKYLEMKYPQCNVWCPHNIGSGICSDYPPYNTAECGWDGGDCPVPVDVEGYINCTVPFPNKIGNKVCEDWPPYNTENCGFDGGDCLYYKVVVDGYPNCSVGHPEWIRSGQCADFAPYNTPECGYDGGDCDPPE